MFEFLFGSCLIIAMIILAFIADVIKNKRDD